MDDVVYVSKLGLGQLKLFMLSVNASKRIHRINVIDEICK